MTPGEAISFGAIGEAVRPIAKVKSEELCLFFSLFFFFFASLEWHYSFGKSNAVFLGTRDI